MELTYPPELLPVASSDDDAEVVVCTGECERPDKGPCARCQMIYESNREISN